MAQMIVDIGAMRQALTEVTNAAATARSTLASVEQLNGSLPGVWQGSAASRYQATITEWCTQYRRVVTALDTLRDGLQRSTSTLEQAEHNAETLSRA